MSWDNTKKLQELKVSILKQKMMMNIVIESNYWIDKLYDYAHMTVASIMPVMSIINNRVQCTVDGSTTAASIMVGIIVAIMVKIKSYVPSARKCQIAKEQLVKYENLYKQIEAEMLKSESKRQSYDEFLYWMTKSLNDITLSDPTMSRSDQKKFINMCDANNVPHININNPLELIGCASDADKSEFQDTVRRIDTKKDMDDVLQRWKRLRDVQVYT